MPVEVHVVDHPLITDSLTRIRDASTPNALFRQELERVGILLLAEATRARGPLGWIGGHGDPFFAVIATRP